MNFDRTGLRRHLQDKHQMLPTDYLEQYGTMESKEALHRCKLCNKSLKQNIDSIGRHLKVKHGMTTEAYKKQFQLEKRQVEIRVEPDPRKSATLDQPMPDMSQGIPKHILMNEIGHPYEEAFSLTSDKSKTIVAMPFSKKKWHLQIYRVGP